MIVRRGVGELNLTPADGGTFHDQAGLIFDDNTELREDIYSCGHTVRRTRLASDPPFGDPPQQCPECARQHEPESLLPHEQILFNPEVRRQSREWLEQWSTSRTRSPHEQTLVLCAIQVTHRLLIGVVGNVPLVKQFWQSLGEGLDLGPVRDDLLFIFPEWKV